MQSPKQFSTNELLGQVPDSQYFRVAEPPKDATGLPRESENLVGDPFGVRDGWNGRNALIRMSPSFIEEREGPRSRGLSLDVFRWKPTGKPEELPEAKHPGGLFRVVRSVRFGDGLDERLKTFVVVEVFEGHQIIKTWRISDLVHYVNELGRMAETGRGVGIDERLENERRDAEVEGSVRRSSSLKDLQHRRVFSGCQSPVERRETDSAGVVHHHYHHHYHHGTRRAKGGFGTGPRSSTTSQLMYRDLRQVFTDGSPVPSIESRRHCIVLCLPPLSCLITVDRVFLLVVQDMNMDGLIYRLERLQLKHLGLLGRAQAEISGIGASAMTGTVEKAGAAGNAVTTDATTPTPDFRSSNYFSGSRTPSSDELTLPFEIEALELLVFGAFEQLDADIACLESRFTALSPRVKSPNTEFGEDLHLLKSHVTMYQNRVGQLDKAFEALIADPTGLVHMELSRRRDHGAGMDLPSPLPDEQQILEPPNPDLEILLEFFDQEIDMFRQRLLRLDGQIDSLDFLVNLKLSLGRNAMIRWDVASSMAGACMGFGTLIAGLFGMNLLNEWEGSYTAFWMTCMLIGIATLVLLTMIGVVMRCINL